MKIHLKAIIPKGTRVLQMGRDSRLAGKTYSVTIDRIDQGWVAQNPWDARHNHGTPSRIVWSGRDSWCWADLEDVDLQIEAYERLPPIVTRADVQKAIELHGS